MHDSLDQEIQTLQSVFWSERDPEGLAFASLADAFRRKGEVRQALDLLTDGMSRHPDFATGHAIAARLYHDQGMDFEAELAARRVLELDPENLVGLSTLASLLSAKGDVEGAERARNSIRAVDPDSYEARALPASPLVAEEAEGTGSELESSHDTDSAEPFIDLSTTEGLQDEALDKGGTDEELSAAMDSLGLVDEHDAGGLAEALGDLDTGPELEFEDLDALTPYDPTAMQGQPVDLAPLAPEGPEPDFVDQAALTPDVAEPDVMELGALAPDEAEAAEAEPVELAALAPDETEPEVTEPEVMDLAALAPDAAEPEAMEAEPEVMELAALAPDAAEPEAMEAEPDVMELAALTPDEAEPEVREPEVMDLAALAPDAAEPEAMEAEPDVMELAALAPDEAEPEVRELEVMDLAALAPDGAEPEAMEAEPEVMDLAALAPDEAEPEVMDLAALAPDEAEPEVMETEPEVMELAALAPDEAEPEPMDLAALAPEAVPKPESEATDATFVPGSGHENPAGPDRPAEPIYTRTLADLYIKQGFDDKALEVLKALQSRNPGDTALAERIATLEAGGTPEIDVPEPQTPGDGHSEDEVEVRARELAEHGQDGPEAVDTPFAWNTEASDEDDPDEPPVGNYFDTLLAWEDRVES